MIGIGALLRYRVAREVGNLDDVAPAPPRQESYFGKRRGRDHRKRDVGHFLTAAE